MAALCIAHLGAFLSAPLRSGRAQMSLAVAPPAAPPTITGGGGGDGGGGGPGEFLRMLTSTEEVLMLNDWSSRARIYKMSDRPEVSERHEAALSVLELMRASHTADLAARAAPKKVAVGADFAWARDSTVSTWAFRTPGQMCHVPTPAAPPPARRLALGLFSAPPPANANAASAGAVTSEVRPEAHAIATAEILPDGTLVVNQLAVHPSETHREGSTTALRMLCGLRALASAVQTELNIEPLRQINKGRYWLAGVALLSSSHSESCDVEGTFNCGESPTGFSCAEPIGGFAYGETADGASPDNADKDRCTTEECSTGTIDA